MITGRVRAAHSQARSMRASSTSATCAVAWVRRPGLPTRTPTSATRRVANMSSSVRSSPSTTARARTGARPRSHARAVPLWAARCRTSRISAPSRRSKSGWVSSHSSTRVSAAVTRTSRLAADTARQCKQIEQRLRSSSAPGARATSVRSATSSSSSSGDGGRMSSSTPSAVRHAPCSPTMASAGTCRASSTSIDRGLPDTTPTVARGSSTSRPRSSSRASSRTASSGVAA